MPGSEPGNPSAALDDMTKDTVRFPVRLSLVWISLLLSIIALISIQIRNLAISVYNTYEEKATMAELNGLILTYDEVLTMSTHMAVATQNSHWESRYREYEPKLDAVIQKATQLDQELHVAQTQDANERLVAMEHEAFSLVQQGRAAEGQLLLDSFEYHRDKQDYTKGMAAAMQHLEARLEETVLEKTSSMRKSIISVVVLTILALSTWVFLVLRLMRWRTLLLSAQEERRRAHEALRNTNQNLEAIITERTQEVQHKHDELHRLTSHLLAIEEKERVRLSTILHDELQQILVTAQLRLGASAGNMQGAESGELEVIAGLIRSGIQTTRSLSSTLNPTAQSDDLLSALRHLSIRHQNTMDLRVHLHVEEQLPQPSKATHQLLIRAASEMLFNITKHAQVQEAFLSLQVDDSGCFQLCVEDEGVGMPTTDLQEFSGMGLLSIHQRAQWLDGSLLIENRTPQGSTVCLTLPILAG